MPRLLVKFEFAAQPRKSPSAAAVGQSAARPIAMFAIDNLAVSDRHARVYVVSDFLVLEDLGSLNGTYVNNARIERTLLSDGDIVQIGKHQFNLTRQNDASSNDADDLGRSSLRRAPAPKLTETAVLDTPRTAANSRSSFPASASGWQVQRRSTRGTSRSHSSRG